MTDSNQPLITFAGEHVALGPFCRAMLPAVYTWLNDLEVMRTYSMRWSPKTLGGVEQWYETVTGAGDTVLFAVYRSRDMALIGSTMLLNISHFHRIADYDIILGEKACWGQGYGTEATRLAVDDGFTALGLHNIMLTVRSYNERGVRAYSRAGFKIIGRRREARRFGGQAYDLIYMECLATEFASPVLQRLLPAHTETTGQA